MDQDIENIDVDYNSFPLLTKENTVDYLLGENNAWVSDIWAFWDFILRKHTSYISDVDDKVKKYSFLKSLLEQAQYFFQAAETAPIKSQPLLYYYSFMNLAKIVINICDDATETKWMDIEYKHGLAEDTGSHTSLDESTISCKFTDNSVINVAPRFMHVMDDSVEDNRSYTVKELLASCLGIHRAFSATYGTDETFYRIDNINVIKEKEIIKFRALIHASSDKILSLQEFYGNICFKEYTNLNGEKSQGYIWEEVCPIEEANKETQMVNLAKHVRKKCIWGITDGQYISQYISSTTVRMSAESIIYMLMYIFGSITRYRPYLFNEFLSDENRWLMSEFLKTQPKQFIYLVTYRVLGKNIRQSWMTKL